LHFNRILAVIFKVSRKLAGFFTLRVTSAKPDNSRKMLSAVRIMYKNSAEGSNHSHSLPACQTRPESLSVHAIRVTTIIIEDINVIVTAAAVSASTTVLVSAFFGKRTTS